MHVSVLQLATHTLCLNFYRLFYSLIPVISPYYSLILPHYSCNYSTQTPKCTCINANNWLKVWNCIIKRDRFLPTGGGLACTHRFRPKSESCGACSLSRSLGYVCGSNSCTLELSPRVWIVCIELLLHVGPFMSHPRWMQLLFLNLSQLFLKQFLHNAHVPNCNPKIQLLIVINEIQVNAFDFKPPFISSNFRSLYSIINFHY